MKTRLLMTPIFTVATATLMLGAAGPAAALEEFEEAQLFFELNDTDGDLGIHGKVDGGPWVNLFIIDPNWRRMMNVKATGRLWRQELTELFFESAEPTFDQVAPEEFFNRFPQGDYWFVGWGPEAGTLLSSSEIRHVMPAPPGNITVSGLPLAPTCDDEDDAFDPLLIPSIPAGNAVIIDWDPVTTFHPDIGKEGEINAALYQVVVEIELEIDGEDFLSVFSVDLPPDPAGTSMTVPTEVIDLGEEFKFEVLVREDQGGNQTATESCFLVE